MQDCTEPFADATFLQEWGNLHICTSFQTSKQAILECDQPHRQIIKTIAFQPSNVECM